MSQTHEDYQTISARESTSRDVLKVELELLVLAVQDGIEPDDLRGFVGVRTGIFVGGSTAWKERTIPAWAALAREYHAWCHVGRVNTARRIAQCTAVGVTSFDGTSATRFAKTLPLLDATRRQLGLAIDKPT